MKPITVLTFLFLFSFSTYAQVDQLTKSLNDYSFDLYNQLKSDTGNLFVSPLSTYFALLTAYEGAKNETKKEFEKVLHIQNNNSLSGFKTFSENLIHWRDTSNYLSISNAVWVQNNLSVNREYKDNIFSKYSSEINPVDFNQPTTASNEINSWVNNKTNGLIKNMISPNQINEDTRMIISNAIYFEGAWQDEFKKLDTKLDTFYLADNTPTGIKFMNRIEKLSYYENDEFQFVSKPYKGNDKSFCIILPKERDGLANVEKNLNSSLLDEIWNDTVYANVKLSVPKFKLETSYSLVEKLKKLGLVNAFTPKADFSGITKDAPLMINNVYHKTYFEINERHTKAAAATLAGMVITGVKRIPDLVTVKADHPFVFMIIDNSTKAILFMGRFVQPEQFELLSQQKNQPETSLNEPKNNSVRNSDLYRNREYSQAITLKGRIIDYETSDPISHVNVISVISDNDGWGKNESGTVSGKDGKFEFTGKPGWIDISYIGYSKVRIVNIPSEIKEIDFGDILMLQEILRLNSSDLYDQEELKEQREIGEKNLIEDLNIEILGKKLKPYFEGSTLIVDCDKNENN